MDETFDVVVAGSGSAGMSAAVRARDQGLSVLVLEKGPLLRPHYQLPGERSDFRRDEVSASGAEKILRVPGVANAGSTSSDSSANLVCPSASASTPATRD